MTNWTRKIKSATLWIVLRFAIVGILGIVTMPLLARFLSVEEYGIYNLLFSLIWYIAVLSAFGVTNVFQRFIPEAYQKENYGLIKNLVFNGILLKLIFSSSIILLVIIFSEYFGNLFNVDGWRQYFSYFGFGIIIFLELSLISVALQGVFLHKYISIANIICVIVRTVGLCIVLLSDKGLHGVLWIEIITWSINLGLLLAFYFRYFLKQHRKINLSPIPFKRYVRYGAYSFFSEIGFAVLSSSTDLLIITIFLGPFHAGLYGLCVRIVNLFVKVLPNSIFKEMIVPVFFSRYAQNNDIKELNRMFNFLIKINLFFTVPLAITTIILGDEIIPLVFGDKYNDVYTTLCVVVGFFVINTIQDPIENTLRAIEKVNIVLWGQVFAVFNLIGDLLVVKPFGILGVALVTSFAILFKNLFCYYHAKKHANINFEYKGLLIILINSLLLLLFFYFVQGMIKSVFSLIVIIIFGIIIYLTINYFNIFINNDEKQFVMKIFPIKLFR